MVRQNMERPTVAIARVETDVFAAVERAIKLAGGLGRLIGPTSRVLVKPNLWASEPSGTGKVTDVRVVEAVARHVLALGPQRLVIGEGSAAGYLFMKGHNTEEAFTISGVRELAQRLSVDLVNLNTDDSEEIAIPGSLVMPAVRIARTALDSDVIISVPVLKTHVSAGVTLSLKNMKGVLPGPEKRKTHQLGLEKAIADLASVMKPHFVLLDAIVGMEGLWEYPEDCVPLNVVLAGADALAVDSVGAALMGFDPDKILHLRLCADRGLGEFDLSRIRIVGERLEDLKRPFKPSFAVLSDRYPGVRVIEKDACTGCHRELTAALHNIRAAGYLPEQLAFTVAIGAPGELPDAENVLIMGVCAGHLADSGVFIKGCPPSFEEIVEAIGGICPIDPKVVVESRRRALAEM